MEYFSFSNLKLEPSVHMGDIAQSAEDYSAGGVHLDICLLGNYLLLLHLKKAFFEDLSYLDTPCWVTSFSNLVLRFDNIKKI